MNRIHQFVRSLLIAGFLIGGGTLGGFAQPATLSLANQAMMPPQDCVISIDADAASSVSTDGNGNGIDDAWELRYFGNLTTCTSASINNLDGLFDRDAYLLGLDPTKNNLGVTRRPVTRADYVDFVRDRAAAFESGPDHAMYGPRHALGALAVFATETDPLRAARLAAGIKQTLHFYSDWVNTTVRQDGGIASEEGPTLCALYFRELRRRGFMTIDDERWARDLLLTVRQYQMAWRPGDGLWRGSHHRSQAQGIAHALAAAFYPNEPGASAWSVYAANTWSDWWDFRDIGINDTGYFFLTLSSNLLGAELLGRTATFTDPQIKAFFDRLMEEVTPDGTVIPYGSNFGYNTHAGARIFALELAARYTRDGRYKWVAQRLMNHLQARTLGAYQLPKDYDCEDIAVASLICDDRVVPVEPSSGSSLLWRKEIFRMPNSVVATTFPGAGGLDCNLYMTQRTMPSKLVLRSGWKPGDLFLLAECYVRHDPMNPTAILGLERFSAGFAEMLSEKFVSRENAVEITDPAQSAIFLGRKNFKGDRTTLPLGWTGMESRVEPPTDHATASHATINVTKYMGYEATQTREFLLVKNRFVLVRDETVFNDSFRATVGPVWNTQNVSEASGNNWVNTWFETHSFQNVLRYTVPPMDLLIYYGNKEGAAMTVEDIPDGPSGQGPMKKTRYAWTGDVSPGQRLQFVQVLFPHVRVGDETTLAQGIRILLDQPGTAAVLINTNAGIELASLNSAGGSLTFNAAEFGRLTTDARACYVKIVAGTLVSVMAEDATYLSFNDQLLLQSATRTNYETTP